MIESDKMAYQTNRREKKLVLTIAETICPQIVQLILYVFLVSGSCRHRLLLVSGSCRRRLARIFLHLFNYFTESLNLFHQSHSTRRFHRLESRGKEKLDSVLCDAAFRQPASLPACSPRLLSAPPSLLPLSGPPARSSCCCSATCSRQLLCCTIGSVCCQSRVDCIVELLLPGPCDKPCQGPTGVVWEAVVDALPRAVVYARTCGLSRAPCLGDQCAAVNCRCSRRKDGAAPEGRNDPFRPSPRAGAGPRGGPVCVSAGQACPSYPRPGPIATSLRVQHSPSAVSSFSGPAPLGALWAAQFCAALLAL